MDTHLPSLGLREEVPVCGTEQAKGQYKQQQFTVYELVQRPPPHEQQPGEAPGSGRGHFVLIADRHPGPGVCTVARPLTECADLSSLWHRHPLGQLPNLVASEIHKLLPKAHLLT